MPTIELKRQQDAEWIRTHTLSQEQLQKLLDDKMKRAYTLQQALTKREMLAKRR